MTPSIKDRIWYNYVYNCAHKKEKVTLYCIHSTRNIVYYWEIPEISYSNIMALLCRLNYCHRYLYVIHFHLNSGHQSIIIFRSSVHHYLQVISPSLFSHHPHIIVFRSSVHHCLQVIRPAWPLFT